MNRFTVLITRKKQGSERHVIPASDADEARTWAEKNNSNQGDISIEVLPYTENNDD